MVALVEYGSNVIWGYVRRWIGWFATPAIYQFFEFERQKISDCEWALLSLSILWGKREKLNSGNPHNTT